MWLQEEFVASDVSESAAGEQTMRRDQAEVKRLQDRLDVLYVRRKDSPTTGSFAGWARPASICRATARKPSSRPRSAHGQSC